MPNDRQGSSDPRAVGVEGAASARPGLAGTLRAAAVAGLQIGTLAGLVDGLAAAIGLDSEFFVLQIQAQSLGAALPSVRLALGGIAANFGPILGSVLVYAGVGLIGTSALGLLLHRLLRRFGARRRHGLLWALALGTWLGFSLWWWTRPAVLGGYSAVHPLRLAVLAAILCGGWLAGFGIERFLREPSEKLRRAANGLVTLGLVAGGLFFATDGPGGGERGVINERTRDLPNVLIFVVDALRADVLSCYGSTDVQTPVIDSVAERGVLFERAFVQAPFTWSSFGSLLTGKYPRRHGLVKMAPGVRMRPNVTLPFYLQGARRTDGVELRETDYVGAAFMTGTLSHGSGLLRGFDYYCEALVGHDLVEVRSEWSRFRSGLLPWLFWSKLLQRLDPQRVASTAIDWFGEHEGRRFVSMVHYYSTHTPYAPVEPFRSQYVDPDYDGPFSTFEAFHREAIEDGEYTPTEADVRRIAELYHGGVAQADAMIGRVLDELERSGQLDDTIVVITSDHGEELGEHGVWEHNFMYQTNLEIPLIISWPRKLPQGRRVAARVDSIDVLPTLCGLMGLERPDAALRALLKEGKDDKVDVRELVDGVDLRPWIDGRDGPVRDYSFAENGRFKSIQDDRWKLIVRRELFEGQGWQAMLADPEVERPRFFDLENDPGEFENVFDAHPAEAQRYFVALKAWSDSLPIAEQMVEKSARDLREERRQQQAMQALGYGGGVGEGMEDGEDDGR